MKQIRSDSRILTLDDDPQVTQQLEAILRTEGYLHIKTTSDADGFEEAFFVFQPDLILLDLVMPRTSGFEVLTWVRTRMTDTFLPVIVLTADVKRETRELALELGASDFLNKPIDPIELLLRAKNLLHTRHLHLMVRGQNERLERKVQERTQELEDARYEVLKRLAVAAEYRDDATGEHTRRVADQATKLAGRLGLASEQVKLITLTAPLHDIGKIGVPDTILNKPGKLTELEFQIVKTHTTIGADILSGSNVPLLKTAEEIARSHHERWDGSGYPYNLSGEDIPLTGRIVCIVDVYDALTHRRPYKHAWPSQEAMKEVRDLSGRYFDPQIAKTFCEMYSNGDAE